MVTSGKQAYTQTPIGEHPGESYPVIPGKGKRNLHSQEPVGKGACNPGCGCVWGAVPRRIPPVGRGEGRSWGNVKNRVYLRGGNTPYTPPPPSAAWVLPPVLRGGLVGWFCIYRVIKSCEVFVMLLGGLSL